MLKKTHIVTGIASALAITQPSTINGIVSSVLGGALGGWIVDIDCKKIDDDKETIYDTIIELLFISLFVLLDFVIGNGICQYVFENFGPIILGTSILILLLLIFGFKSKHRTFTHSIFSMFLFTSAIYYLCKPMTIAFAIGYFSHIFIDLFNKKGLMLFYPFKKKICFKVCYSDKTANNFLFWIMFVLSVISASILFSRSMINNAHLDFVNRIRTLSIYGINSFQLYLIFINLITFLMAERSYRNSWKEMDYDTDDDVRIQVDFETWILNVLIFAGGSFGILLTLIIHLEFPSAYNGNWWSFCYTSLLFWVIVYLYIMNPFNLTITAINFMTISKLFVLIYLIVINYISGYIFNRVKSRRFDEYSFEHTLLIFLGWIGGTLGAIVSVVLNKNTEKYNYVSIGFPLMLISQIICLAYLMMVNII